MKSGNREAFLVTVISATGLLVRLILLKAQVFYIDEGFNFMLADRSLVDILAGSGSESNPPLPVLISHFWIAAGHSLGWIRTMPLLFSIASIPFIYLLGRRIGGPVAGAIAAGTAAVAPMNLALSHVFRYPALAIFLSSSALWMYSEIKIGERKKFVWPLAAVCSLCLYTHYFFVFLLFFFNVHFLINRNRNISLWMWIVSQAAAVASFVPWLGSAANQGSRELGLLSVTQVLSHMQKLPFKGAINALQAPFTWPYAVEKNKFFLVFILAWILIAAVSIALSGLPRRNKNFIVWGIAICFLIPYIAMLFVGLRLHMMYFCIFSPLSYCAVSMALAGKSSVYLRVATAAGLVAILVISLSYYFSTASPPSDNQTAIKHIKNNYREGDVVVINPAYQASMFYYFGSGEMRLFGIPEDFDILEYNFNDATQVTDDRLEELVQMVPGCGRVWAFYGFGDITKPDSKRRTLDFLENNFSKISEIKFAPMFCSPPTGRLYLFQKSMGECESDN